MLPKGRERFVLVISTTVAILTGLALFAIACRGIWGLSIYIQREEILSALSIGVLSLGAFLLSLLFLMPKAFRHIIQLGGKPENRGPITFGASLVLLAVLLASAVSVRESGNLVFGVLPRGYFSAVVALFSVMFLALFVFPGLAYPARRKGDALSVQTPTLRTVKGLYNIKTPWLRRVIKITVIGNVALWGLAVYAQLFAQVIPEPGIVEANRRYLILTFLLSLLPLSMLLVATPINGGSTLMDHVRAKGFLLLGIGVLNGFACIDVSERG